MDGFVDTDIDLAALAAQITQGDQDVATGELQADLAESPVLADAPGEAALLARLHETLESAWLAQGDGYSAENFNMEAALGDRAFLDWAQAFLTQSPAGAQHPVTSTPAPGSPAPDAASPDTTPTTNTKLLFTDPPPDDPPPVDEIIVTGTIIRHDPIDWDAYFDENVIYQDWYHPPTPDDLLDTFICPDRFLPLNAAGLSEEHMNVYHDLLTALESA
ncbi:MAG TPA: hypothetical protein ENK01_01210, partial [Hellea balneolensis]|nr:hypothetical protein [Hellea balneolensis]